MSYFTIGYGIIPKASAAEVKEAVEEVAPAIIEEKMGDVVETTVETKITDAIDSGKADDIRTFSSKDSFPNPGIEGVEYIDSTTGYEYIWSNGRYILLNEHVALSDSDIDNLDGWDE